ncbi:hypothetical protein GQ457_03G013370 [Hibiscus cannabinus]
MTNGWFEKDDRRKVVEGAWTNSNNFKQNVGFKLKKDLEKKIEVWDELDDTKRLNPGAQDEVKNWQWDLWEAFKLRESLWKQKSRVIWLQEGDSNIAFFHRVTKAKAKRSKLAGLHTAEGWSTYPNKVKRRVFEFFSKHYNAPIRGWKAKLCLPFRQLSSNWAGLRERPFSEDDIKVAIWSCEESKAPGPDGFNLDFFKKLWDLVRIDLLNMMEDFYHNGNLPNNVKSTLLALIPKTEYPVDLSDFRPISLVSLVFKIVANILANRLSGVLEEIISETQSAFIKGRHTFDGILIANEIAHTLQHIFLNIPIQSAYQKEGRNRVKVKDLKPKRIKDYLEYKFSQRSSALLKYLLFNDF